MRHEAILIIITLLSQHDRCQADSIGDFFETCIRPLLSEKCFSCHSALAGKSKCGLKLDTRSRVFEGGDSGPNVNSSDTGASLILRAVRRLDSEVSAMPPEDEHLTDLQIADPEKWVADGAFYPESNRTESNPKDHWAFQPLRIGSPPILNNHLPTTAVVEITINLESPFGWQVQE